jgi:hypothetical protein
MIRVPVVILAVAAGFLLGLGARTAKDALASPPSSERTVYCPLGTTDPECVAARLRYERGELAAGQSSPRTTRIP